MNKVIKVIKTSLSKERKVVTGLAQAGPADKVKANRGAKCRMVEEPGEEHTSFKTEWSPCGHGSVEKHKVTGRLIVHLLTTGAGTDTSTFCCFAQS